jgi:serine/threonine-protein kinase SRPK3
MELMGEFPKSVAFAGKYSHEFFTRKGQPPRSPFHHTGSPPTLPGELRHIQKLRYWPLDAVLHDKYLFSRDEADTIASFLNPMLRLHPEKRATAGELVHHHWLEGAVVQGEIDVIRRAEEEEEAARRVGDADAMKPVGDVEPALGPASASAAGVPKLSMPLPSSAGAKENVVPKVSASTGTAHEVKTNPPFPPTITPAASPQATPAA